ncbi:hypothetical protein [Sphingorhabdus sp. EL138]|uniref:hypothetical protein n=1 Tax=Sphingorhabdus sp. EL138 TaxID=2073156 RepID=UPI0013A55BD8|nr:hypothetical protein [Sphingorhabdus sp. EL138]
MFDDLIEISATFLPTLNNQSTVHKWLPYSAIGFYPIGTLFDGKSITVPKVKNAKRLFEMEYVETTEFEDNSFSEAYGQAIPHGLEDFASFRRKTRLDEEAGNNFYLTPYAELSRFYGAAASLLIDGLSRTVSTDSYFDDVVDESRTGFVDDKTFRVAPRLGFVSRACALQMALIMSNREIANFWRFQRAHWRNARKDNNIVDAGTFNIIGDLNIEAELSDPWETKFPELPDDSIVRQVTRIISDCRMPKFETLILELPFDLSVREFEDAENKAKEEENPKENTRYHHGGVMEVVRGRRPSIRPVILAAAKTSFLRSFPNFRDVRFETASKTGITYFPQRARRTIHKMIDQMSFLPPGGDEKIAGVRHAVKDFRNLAALQPVVSSAYFLDYGEFETPQLVQVKDVELKFPIGNFLTAGKYLHDGGDLDTFNSSLRRGTEILTFIELPESWGYWAWFKDHGRGRRIAFLPVAVEDQTVWTLEIERKTPKEAYPVGIVMNHSQLDDHAFLFSLLKRISDRRQAMYADDDVRGTWPRGSYQDVTIDNIVHHRTRNTPGNLGEVLMERSTEICEGVIVTDL